MAKPKPTDDLNLFPIAALRMGNRARRASWAPGHELMLDNARGRSGAVHKLMTTGSRAGVIEWKPQNLADELMADDWHVIDVAALAAAQEQAEADARAKAQAEAEAAAQAEAEAAAQKQGE